MTTGLELVPVKHGQILDRDAFEIGDLYRRGRGAMVDSVKYLIEAGRGLTAKKQALAHGEWLSWLKDNADALGFSDRSTASRLMKLAGKCCVDAPFDDEEALRLNRIAWGNNVRGISGTGEDEWHTPERYVELARKVLGAFDLDPASSKKAQKVIKAEKFFTKKDNGLEHDWYGRVWLNPPYAQPLIAQFVLS